MPNPLSALMSSPGAAAKPDTTPQNTRTSQGAASFQMVMNQEADLQSGHPDLTDLLIPESDAAPELEDIVPDDEIADAHIAPKDQPPAELSAQAPEVIQIPVTKALVDKPLVLPPAVNSDTPSVSEATPATVPTDALRLPEGPAQRTVSPAVQAMVFGTVPPRNTPDAATRPMSFPVGLATPDARPKDMPDLSPFFRPERDVPNGPATPPVVQSQPVTPDRAPTLAQLQVLAADQINTQIETQVIPEIEEIQTTRDIPAVSSARESASTVQAMTATARAETARAVASQMATVVSARGQPGTIEVALNPEELGRVSIVLNGREDGLHMTITAERPETLDMMRRHLSVLETEFQNFGLGDLSFDLGTSADEQHHDPDTDEGTRFADTRPEPVTESRATISKLGPDGRIDMRL
ncbi:Flagellar hook-length control protein FliK [Ruegeria denitrificans]|uniref:Flagellar hook-length control protein FliK n=1 Tax=Ruegeria denitrificans TaxID=1715692 RepID=A0A0P1IQ03_9RHOB|nr:flagellar hook-length control protein FliK [Ruegeria denitrificans]CUK11972.1 Flagellar hook-length control protein FliK [Ruegeria denitrificans]